MDTTLGVTKTITKTITPLLLNDSELKALLHFVQAHSTVTSRESHWPQIAAICQRLDAGGDEVIVQAGIEGGVIQGWTANCPVNAIGIEWDGEDYLTIDEHGKPKLVGFATNLVEFDPEKAANFSRVSRSALQMELYEHAVVVTSRDGRTYCARAYGDGDVFDFVHQLESGDALRIDQIASVEVVSNNDGRIELLETFPLSVITDPARSPSVCSRPGM